MRRPLYRVCLNLVARWWRTDRVRISPREGELLRLQPGCVLTVNGVPAEVRVRMVVHERDTRRGSYQCQTELGPAILEVHCADGGGAFDIVLAGGGRKKA